MIRKVNSKSIKKAHATEKLLQAKIESTFSERDFAAKRECELAPIGGVRIPVSFVN
jgi:hypothetical protein